MNTVFSSNHSKNFTKAMLILSIVFFNYGVSNCFASEESLMDKATRTDSTTRMGQVIKKVNLLEHPSYQSGSTGSVEAKEKVSIQSRERAWYFISSASLGQVEQPSGWINMLNVRFIATAKREGRLGVESLFSSATNDSLPTVSTGVRGFDENDLKNSKADLKQLLQLNTYRVSTGSATRFARQGKLTINKVKVKED